MGSCFVESFQSKKLDDKKVYSLVLTRRGGLLKSNYCWMGRKCWHAIKNLLNLPFMIRKVVLQARLSRVCPARLREEGGRYQLSWKLRELLVPIQRSWLVMNLVSIL